ncbi:MAG TPA: response regulator [Candidatus Methylomirabilis sp.]|nr:response regulator [Gemmatimonadales bacterium]HYB40733.1 response regulator [Candidatus Methylomirabilis sp.]
MSAAPAGTTAPADAVPPVPRVLIVEDDAAQARLVELLVAAAGLACVGRAATAQAAVRLAAGADIVLMDYRLEGDRSGLDALRELRAAGYPGSVVMMTGHGSERVAAEALHLGASDYIIKDDGFTQLLPEVLARVVRVREIERQLAAAQHSLIRAERRAAIGEIVVALSHEINNPLMALSSQLDLLGLDERRLPPTSVAALAQARQQLARIAALLRRLAELDHEEATTYVGTTRMTDLATTPGGPKAGPGR